MAVTPIGTLIQFSTGNNAVGDLNADLTLITTQFNTLVTASNTLISGLTLPAAILTSPTLTSPTVTTGGLTIAAGGEVITAGGLQIEAGNVGIGGVAVSQIGVNLSGPVLSVQATQYGLYSDATYSSAATTQGTALFGRVNTAAAAYTMAQAIGLVIEDALLGAGSAITTQYGILIAPQTQGSTNYALYTTGVALVRFGGQVTMATIGAFATNDKYLIVDSSGNIHKSATGPGS
jgi:hypothetical protein